MQNVNQAETHSHENDDSENEEDQTNQIQPLESMSDWKHNSTIDPKNVKEALSDAYWINSMQYEQHRFERSNVWYWSQDLLTEPSYGPDGCLEINMMRVV